MEIMWNVGNGTWYEINSKYFLHHVQNFIYDQLFVETMLECLKWQLTGKITKNDKIMSENNVMFQN